jgi:DNA-binding NarL/FixJ family response regulator
MACRIGAVRASKSSAAARERSARTLSRCRRIFLGFRQTPLLRAALKAAARHRFEFGGFFDRPPAEPVTGPEDADGVWIVDAQMLRAALQSGHGSFEHMRRSGCIVVAARANDLSRLQDYEECIAGVILVDKLEDQLSDAVLLAGSRHMVLPLPMLTRRQPFAARRSAPLPPDQRELLSHLTRGMTNRQIAAAMDLPGGAVKALIRRLLGRFGFRNRTEAAVVALRSGLSGGEE